MQAALPPNVTHYSSVSVLCFCSRLVHMKWLAAASWLAWVRANARQALPFNSQGLSGLYCIPGLGALPFFGLLMFHRIVQAHGVAAQLTKSCIHRAFPLYPALLGRSYRQIRSCGLMMQL